MELAEFELTAGPAGSAIFILNGQDLTERTAAIQVNVGEGQLTTVHVTVAGGGEVKGSGIVNLYHPASGAVLVEMLGRLNAKKIDEEALARMDYGNAKSLTETIIEIIKEKVDEAQSRASVETPGGADGGRLSDHEGATTSGAGGEEPSDGGVHPTA